MDERRKKGERAARVSDGGGPRVLGFQPQLREGEMRGERLLLGGVASGSLGRERGRRMDDCGAFPS